MKAKKSTPINLSEYAEEKEPFDSVIRKLARVAPVIAEIKPSKKTKKRPK